MAVLLSYLNEKRFHKTKNVTVILDKNKNEK